MADAKINYLSNDIIKTFIEANILNAIDGKLLKTKFDHLRLEIKSPFQTTKYCIKVFKEKDKDFKLQVTIPLYCSSYQNQLRYMMGATLKILDVLASSEPKKESVLRVVR